MTVMKKCAAGVSAVSLAVGMSVFGAGAASAQGSLEMIGDLPDTIADLQLADQALNGPVSVTANAEGGPTVTYTNDTEIDLRCSGFTMPYTTVAENDIDPNALDGATLVEMMAVAEIVYAGGGAAIMVSENGEPVSFESEELDIVFTVNNLIAKGDNNTGTLLAPGDAVTWVAASPEEPSAAAVMCVSDEDRSLFDMAFSFGVDKQVVADQINDILGPLGSVGAGSVSGGSVELGAAALAPLGELDMGSIGDSADDGGEEEAPQE